VKARRVKGLDPAVPLADNAERIVRVRLDEVCSFMPQAADPAEVTALHDMRIAAKRLRYILEITGPCFGDYAETAVKHTKELQDLLGEIHDCDVQIPEVDAFLHELLAEDAEAMAAANPGAPDLDAAAAKTMPNRGAYAGVAALIAYLRARREVLYAYFLEFWRDLERKGFRARLEYAITERSSPEPLPEAPVPEPSPAPVVPAEALDSGDVPADATPASADGATPEPADAGTIEAT
jgi:hypothetical protein